MPNCRRVVYVCAVVLYMGFHAEALAVIRAAEQGSSTIAVVTAPAPIYVRVGFSTPMRVAAVGTRLNVVGSEGEWTQVQFQDPQFGLRTGWVETRLVRIERPDLQPMDLSVPAPRNDAARVPQAPESAAAAQATMERPVEAPPSRGREGFWFNIGLGYGSAGCNDCDVRFDGFSGGLALGGAVSDKVLLGVGTTGFTRTTLGFRESIGTLDGRIRFYPSRNSGFFINGGVGLGTYSFDGDTEYGLGLMLGLGWDIRVGRNVSLTPFWNGSAMANSNLDANFGQLGLGVTIH